MSRTSKLRFTYCSFFFWCYSELNDCLRPLQILLSWSTNDLILISLTFDVQGVPWISWWATKLTQPNLCLARIIRLAVSRHIRHTCAHAKSALAGKKDKIISTTSASDETRSTEGVRPSLEAILMAKWREGTQVPRVELDLFTSEHWVRICTIRGHVTR